MKLNETSAKYIGFTLLLIVILSLLTTVALDSRDDVAESSNTLGQMAAEQIVTQTTAESSTSTTVTATTDSHTQETEDKKIYVAPTSPKSNLISSAKVLDEQIIFMTSSDYTINVKMKIKTDPPGTSFPIEAKFFFSEHPNGKEYMKIINQSSTDNSGIVSTSVNVADQCGILMVTVILKWDGGSLLVPGSYPWTHGNPNC